MPIRSSLYLLSLCNNRINLQRSRLLINTRAYRFKESWVWIFSFWKSLGCIRGHGAAFQTLFLWNLSSEKEPAARNSWSGAPRSFHHVPQSRAVNTTKMLLGCIQASRPPVLNGFQNPCAPFPCLQIRQIAYSVVLWEVKGFWMNRNGLTIYLSFPFCHFPLPPSTTYETLKWIGSVPDHWLPNPKKPCRGEVLQHGRTHRKRPGLQRLSFHQGERCWMFKNVFLISRPWEQACWTTAGCQNDTGTSPPTTALLSPHTHHAHYRVPSLSPAVLIRQV